MPFRLAVLLCKMANYADVLCKMMNEKDYNLEVLKAIAIMLVLIWHLQPIRIGSDENTTAEICNKILDLTYTKTLIAVPIFYFVSLLLFFKKLQISNQYITKRIKRLMNIFSFWFAIQLTCYLIAKQVSLFLNLSIQFSPNNSNLWWVFIMGGPSLPRVGDSVFYFIFNLILLVIFSYYYRKYATKTIDLISFTVLSLYILLHQYFYAIPYWRIDNFLIYIPITHFISSQYFEKIFTKKIMFLSFLIYILFSIYEILSEKILHTLHGEYDINSLQWGVITLFIFVHIFSFPKKKFIKWLSKYSLGLFALHKYWLLVFLFIFSQLSQKLTINIGDIMILYIYIFIALLTIGFTYLTIRLFSTLRPLKKYVA